MTDVPKEDEPILFRSNSIRTATHRKILLPSDDLTYDFMTPSVTPGTASSTGVSITMLEQMYWTNPIAFKGINIRADRIIGEGFKLKPAEGVNVDPTLAVMAQKECESFMKKNGGTTFWRQAIINALVSGMEWTELMYNDFKPKSLISIGHADFRTIDFRRDLINNKVTLDDEGKPVGYWQYIEDLSQLYRSINVLFGAVTTYENLKAARQRLVGQAFYQLDDPETGQPIAVLTNKPLYLFIDRDELVPLSFDNLNDTPRGISAMLPAWDALVHIENIQFAIAEAINIMGFPKPVISVGDEQHPPTENMMNDAEAVVTDPVRKESFTVPYFAKLAYLTPQLNTNTNDYPDFFLTMAAMGMKVPKEILISEGTANRATAFQQGTDFDKQNEADRRRFEDYVKEIFNLFLRTRFFKTTSSDTTPYVPEIEWNSLFTEDKTLRDANVRENYKAGLLTFNEARLALEQPETEDREKGDSYFSEGTATQGQSLEGAIADNTDYTPQDSHEITSHSTSMAKAVHRLEPKAKLNPALNKDFKTSFVDYKKIAQEDVGTKIVSVSEADAKKIRDALVNGRAAKKSPKTILAEIKSIGGYTDDEARRVAFTENQNLRNSAKLEDAKGKGKKFKVWHATLDSRTSNRCKALHGMKIPIDEKFKVSYKNEQGKEETWEGEHPTSHTWCRCKLAFE